jgi:hypothetical protein
MKYLLKPRGESQEKEKFVIRLPDERTRSNERKTIK